MVRGVSVGGTSVTVTDGSINVTQDPLYEAKMSGLGGETCYTGLLNVSGSFGGLYRSGINTFFSGMLAKTSYSIIVADETDAITATTCYFSGGEISARIGEFAKFTLNFVGKDYSTGGSVSAGSTGGDPGPFTFCSIGVTGASGFSAKIDIPYSADDYILGGTGVSSSIYQSGDAKVSGTVTVAQSASMPGAGSITAKLGSGTVTVTDAIFSGESINVSGRSLTTKTVNWACGSGDITFS